MSLTAWTAKTSGMTDLRTRQEELWWEAPLTRTERSGVRRDGTLGNKDAVVGVDSVGNHLAEG